MGNNEDTLLRGMQELRKEITKLKERVSIVENEISLIEAKNNY